MVLWFLTISAMGGSDGTMDESGTISLGAQRGVYITNKDAVVYLGYLRTVLKASRLASQGGPALPQLSPGAPVPASPLETAQVRISSLVNLFEAVEKQSEGEGTVELPKPECTCLPGSLRLIKLAWYRPDPAGVIGPSTIGWALLVSDTHRAVSFCPLCGGRLTYEKAVAFGMAPNIPDLIPDDLFMRGGPDVLLGTPRGVGVDPVPPRQPVPEPDPSDWRAPSASQDQKDLRILRRIILDFDHLALLFRSTDLPERRLDLAEQMVRRLSPLHHHEECVALERAWLEEQRHPSACGNTELPAGPCVLEVGHMGAHENVDRFRWGAYESQCPATIDHLGGQACCCLREGHLGLHRSDLAGAWRDIPKADVGTLLRDLQRRAARIGSQHEDDSIRDAIEALPLVDGSLPEEFQPRIVVRRFRSSVKFFLAQDARDEQVKLAALKYPINKIIRCFAGDTFRAKFTEPEPVRELRKLETRVKTLEQTVQRHAEVVMMFAPIR